MSSGSSSEYASRICSIDRLLARSFRTKATVIRIPRMVGCPRQISGLMTIRLDSSIAIQFRCIELLTPVNI